MCINKADHLYNTRARIKCRRAHADKGRVYLCLHGLSARSSRTAIEGGICVTRIADALAKATVYFTERDSGRSFVDTKTGGV